MTPEKDAKLRKAATQMEGTFVQQMYKSMRETVPTDGPFSGGSGEEMFNGLLDEHVAADTPTKWHHGLSEAIYRQMREAVQAQTHGAPVASQEASQEPPAQTVVSK
jgi:flagellar protein FlgJ